jgi:hypothetical protein
MGSNWVRGFSHDLTTPWGGGAFLLAQIPAGGTLRRIHFGLDITAWITVNAADNQHSIDVALSNPLLYGILSKVGNGTEALPAPDPPATDPSPPESRWLHWGAVFPVPQSWQPSAPASYVFSGNAHWDYKDTKGQVKATAIPPGDFLDIWLIYKGGDGDWLTVSGTDDAHCKAWWSLLYST